jgi:DNA-binding protein H-NS
MARTSQGIEQLDLDSLSDEQLQELQTLVKEKLDERVQNRLAEYRRIARGAGYELSLVKIGEALQRRGRSRTESGRDDQRRRPVEPKYRNPDNPSETWSGRGHRPKWMEEQLTAGRQLSELAIASTAET